MKPWFEYNKRATEKSLRFQQVIISVDKLNFQIKESMLIFPLKITILKPDSRNEAILQLAYQLNGYLSS
jgi:hypothetical protein